ncbi:MAG: chorismate synthase [Thermoguttaceae bacterium]
MRYFTAGESHGKGILALLDGFPAGVEIDFEQINAELRRRQGGYGRGGRQNIETDTVEVLTGIWYGKTTGAPLTLWVKNRDCKLDNMPEIEYPRPGHADLAGAIKYGTPIRPVLERASARETAARVAAGAVAKLFLAQHGIQVLGYVASIGNLNLEPDNSAAASDTGANLTPDKICELRDKSVVYSLTPERDEQVKQLIDKTAENGDTLGGVIEVRAFSVPIGLGTHTQWDEKLDGKIAQAVMSVQAIKGVEIGLGFKAATLPGSQVHDPIMFDAKTANENTGGFTRPSNNAGGIEGGISNGEQIVVRAAMKPIPTLRNPLPSVHLHTKEPKPAVYERSDVCAVPAASVVVEAAVALEIAKAMI